jgi:hypothetical protein
MCRISDSLCRIVQSTKLVKQFEAMQCLGALQMAVCAATRDMVTRASGGAVPPLVLTKLQALNQRAQGERSRAMEHAATKTAKLAAMDKRVLVRSVPCRVL